MEARAYASEALAPWAEIVPSVDRMTVADLLTIPDDGWRYEVVEGVLVRVAGSRFKATAVAAILLGALISFVRPRGLGVVTGADGVYDFENTGQKDTGLIPDVGFFHAYRRSLVQDDLPIPFAPDLAVDVASPSQSADDMAAKARRYLAGGTALVWVVWPARREVDIWRTGHTAPAATLQSGDILTGDPVITGFLHPVADLFAV